MVKFRSVGLPYTNNDNNRPSGLVWQRIAAFLSSRSSNTQRTYKGILEEWVKFLGAEPYSAESAQALLSVSETRVAAYQHWLKKQPGIAPKLKSSSAATPTTTAVAVVNNSKAEPRDGLQTSLANSTIIKKFAALRRIYRMLVSADIGLTKNPFGSDNIALPSKHTGEKRPTAMIPFHEVEKILAVPGKETAKARRDSAILALLFGCGLRRSEICSIRVGDLKQSVAGTPYVHLRNTKGKRDADQPIPEWALSKVQEVLQDRESAGAQPGDFLFVSFRGPAGLTPTSKPISSAGLYELFKNYCGLAGVSVDAAPHAARATAITKLLADGLSHREVQEFSRHASVQMVEVYDKRHFGVDKNPGKKIKF